jgi:hypothetical protein
MADDRRRLIYELLVEAKGMSDAKKQLMDVGKLAEEMGSKIKKGLMGLAVTFTIKGIADAISEANVMQAQLGTLGLSAEQASKGLRMIEDISIATGASMADASAVMQTSIQIIQQLGGTLSDAAHAAESFTKIALSEGKSAGAAAEEMQMLNFAMQKGEVSAKEFVTMLKSSNVLQGAFESALGKSTQQLIEMAKAGEIGRTELEAVFNEMVKIGDNTTAPATIEGLTNSFTTMAKSLVNATLATAGLGTQATNVYGPLNVLANMLRTVTSFAGLLVGMFINLSTAVVKVGVAMARAVTHPTEALQTLEVLSGQLKASWDEVQASMKAVRENAKSIVDGVTETNEKLQNEHAAALRRADEIEKLEERRAKSLKELAALSKDLQDAIEKESRAREKAAREAEKAERERLDREQHARDALHAQFLENQKERVDEANRLVELRQKAADDVQAQLVAELENGFPQLEKAIDESIGTIVRLGDALKDTFASLFEGGIRNAREFFQVLLRGFAQVFAQKAALQMGDWIDKGIDALLKSWPGSTGSTGGYNSTTGGDWYGAKGGAINQGHLMPFAAGGIVRRPTMFAMGYGGTGVMGEAGPEAIMPLKRGSDGKLGVAATAPMVQIINNTGVAARAHTEQHSDRLTIILEAAQMGANMAEERMNRSLRSGYGATAQSVQRTYGLTRRM